MYFGAAYYPEHRDPVKWDYDLDLMAAAGVNALRVGEFAWTRFEPAEGQYEFSWMDGFAAQARARGIQLLMCPPLRTAPAWLVAKDRGILIIDAEGRQLEFGSRYTFCINHPLLREKGLALAARMAENYHGSPAILGWHLDNEYGDEPDCHCPVCLGKWHEWLKHRYTDIKTLNYSWGNVFWSLEYSSFDQVPTPRHSKTCFSPAHLLNWRRFRSDCTVEMVALHAAALRENGAKQPVTTNNQCLWNPRTDYYDMARHLDLCGTNYYPPYGSNCRVSAFGLATVRSYKNRNFHVHELRSGTHTIPGAAEATPAPGEVMRLTAHAVANGADGIFYFRWRQCPFGCEQSHGSVTGFDGQPTRIYKEVAETGNRLKAMAQHLEGTVVQSEIALLYDFQTRWTMESGIYWTGPSDLYVNRCRTLYSAMRSCGVNVDAVGRGGDFSHYRILVVPFATAIDESLAAKLVQFVEHGGTLVWHPLSGNKTVEACFYPDRLHPELARLFGVRIADFVTSAEETWELSWHGRHYATGWFLDLLQADSSEVQARYSKGWFADQPAVTERRTGHGRAIYVGSLPSAAFYDDFFASLLQDIGIMPLLGTRPPAAVEVTERTAPDGRKFVFVLNCSDTAQEITLPAPRKDLWSGATVVGIVPLPPHGVRVLAQDAAPQA